MAKTPIPTQFEIGALKRKVAHESNLMVHGVGTPWEDRGSLGVIKAFIMTAFRSLFSPAKLWEELSRPETTRDATAFSIGCGFVIGVSWIVHSLWWDLFHKGLGDGNGVPPMLIRDDSRFDISWQTWALGSAIQLACAMGGIILLLNLTNAIYRKFIPHALSSRLPSTLSYNVLAYSLGPALLTLIPMWGWALALIWFMVLVMYAGSRRLAMGGGAVTAGILTILAIYCIGFGAYFVGDLAWSQVTGTSVTYTPPPPPPGTALSS